MPDHGSASRNGMFAPSLLASSSAHSLHSTPAWSGTQPRCTELRDASFLRALKHFHASFEVISFQSTVLKSACKSEKKLHFVCNSSCVWQDLNWHKPRCRKIGLGDGTVSSQEGTMFRTWWFAVSPLTRCAVDKRAVCTRRVSYHPSKALSELSTLSEVRIICIFQHVIGQNFIIFGTNLLLMKLWNLTLMAFYFLRQDTTAIIKLKKIFWLKTYFYVQIF